MAATIEIPQNITVGALAEKLMIPATRLIGELMKNGVMATINEQIDFDTAQIIVSELKLDVELTRPLRKLLKYVRKPLQVQVLRAVRQSWLLWAMSTTARPVYLMLSVRPVSLRVKPAVLRSIFQRIRLSTVTG
jgi:hypothetical protein